MARVVNREGPGPDQCTGALAFLFVLFVRGRKRERERERLSKEERGCGGRQKGERGERGERKLADFTRAVDRFGGDANGEHRSQDEFSIDYHSDRVRAVQVSHSLFFAM